MLESKGPVSALLRGARCLRGPPPPPRGVVLEQPGGRRSHLDRQLVEPLGKGSLVLRRSVELFA